MISGGEFNVSRIGLLDINCLRVQGPIIDVPLIGSVGEGEKEGEHITLPAFPLPYNVTLQPNPYYLIPKSSLCTSPNSSSM